MFDALYETRDDDMSIFGPHWCGPEMFEYGKPALVARYDSPAHSDGQSVEVWCVALPARCYTLRVLDGENSVGEHQPAWPIELSTGSGHEIAKLCARLAEAIATGMLGMKRSVVRHGDAAMSSLAATLRDHHARMGWPSLRDAADELERLQSAVSELTEALECLLPGLVLDLRYADDDDDKDAMRSRIKTVTDALAKAYGHAPRQGGDEK